ncbi:glycerol-3-phosphate dehydrogenase/oxidase [Plebeiibacterium sediminum]|uniref:Glycerol-3-phosphate dehydrogenase/oxidase n=1 Tax=Plebeiibacterium sediminum TaxID=2992112 RepID=A0AAE3M7F6_9BACT|nr:glycerol-3-phosphate dehydrogenase/oxidase [Plebeiobacterium sediminum]MCW3788199.1 glycerol-3-phosphate dehydrogenase/oxidase [Plebeiobacterium sediminum]
MNREKMISDIANNQTIWDIVIIGGGATGMGVAVDASSRGYKVLLVEQADFGKGTSSRSTKLVHGGVRYLQQGNISLVLEALKERGIMRKNAPHLVHDQSFIVPVYDWWEGPFYGVGLKLYDLLAGKLGLGPSKLLSKEETIEHIPTIEQEGLKGGVIYHDGQFDDARMLVNLAQTAYKQGATIINYAKATALIKKDNIIQGIEIEDEESGKRYNIRSKVVINATGVFVDTIRKMDNINADKIMTSSQGVHIVLDKSFLPGRSAIMVPHTDDGRVLFAVPWHDKIIVGTTDTPVDDFKLEPKAQKDEIEFLLTHIGRYLIKDPEHKDIKSIFTGLRPLVNDNDKSNTSSISREHTINISNSGLLTIAGGKWTTYRKMAEDIVEQAIILADLERKPCVTENLQVHGYHSHSEVFGNLAQYGSDAPEIQRLYNEDNSLEKLLHKNYSVTEGEVLWAVRHEMARTPEDFLARRSRILFLDTDASLEMAKRVTNIIAKELQKDNNWIKTQLENFKEVSSNYKY